MKLFPTSQSRQEYIETQITRSNDKFSYCKVSVHDTRKYRNLILNDIGIENNKEVGPILCLGTRNGREVDLFRTAFFGPSLLRPLASVFERRGQSFSSIVPAIESLNRSSLDSITPTSVVGVEINPKAARSDVWIGSFDEMPAEWEGRFGVVFSNSFDQSQDPSRTALEWKRVAKRGAYLIFGFTEGTEPTSTDPVGNIRLEDILDMFDGELVYFQSKGSRSKYSEVIIRI